jgi:type II secretory pathway component PulM
MIVLSALNKHFGRLKELSEPKLQLLQSKWEQLQPREQKLVSILAIFLGLFFLFSIISGLITYEHKLRRQIADLNKFTLYSMQAAYRYKALQQVEANSFNPVTATQIKGDVTQIFQVENPDILIQDGQMTINIPNAEFAKVMTLLDQFRRSYDIFPSQVSITRQSRAGFVSFNATFWVKQ